MNKNVVLLGFLVAIVGVLFIVATSRVSYIENPEWRRWYFYEYGFDLNRDGFNDITGEPWHVGPEPPRLIEGPREYPNLGWGLIVIFVGFVTVLIGLLVKSAEDVKHELRVNRNIAAANPLPNIPNLPRFSA
ncbi:MAG: hypothetical protein QXK47_02280 [Candidatus Bathyarchaeia archaeon]